MSSAEDFFRKGLDCCNKKNWDEAIKLLNKAIKIKPNYVEAINQLGIAYYWKGMFNEALAACDIVLELDPDRAKVYYNKGRTLEAVNRKHDAIIAFRTFIKKAFVHDFIVEISDSKNRLSRLESKG